MIDKIETISKIKVEKIIDNKEVIKLDNRDKSLEKLNINKENLAISILFY